MDSKRGSKFFSGVMYINNILLNNVLYYSDNNVIKYSFGIGTEHKSGMLIFDDHCMGFLGSYSNKDGSVTMLRGNQMEVAYATQMIKDGITKDGEKLVIGTFWNEQHLLQAKYLYGGEDISNGTIVSLVDKTTWETTIERTSWGMLQYDPTFIIKVDFTGTKFEGTCVTKAETWEWIGRAIGYDRNILVKEKILRDISLDKLQMENSIPGSNEISLQNLLNVNQYLIVHDEGAEIMVDLAQQETGVYFQDILVNSLPSEYISSLMGIGRVLPENVQRTMAEHKDYYAAKAVMNMGQLLHSTFQTQGTIEDQAAANKIDISKIQTDWMAVAKEKEFAIQSNDLYLNAYTNKVPDMKGYLSDGEYWAKQLYDLITSEAYLNIWRAQIASSQFPNVKEHIFQFYTKLMVLDNSDAGSGRAQNAVQVMFAAVMTVSSQKVVWQDEYLDQFAAFLKDTVVNLREGNIEILKTVLAQQNAGEIRRCLNDMISVYDNVDEMVLNISELFAFISKTPEAAGRPLVEIVDLAIEKAGSRSGFEKVIKGFGKVGKAEAGKLLRVLCFSGAMAMCFYLFTDQGSAEGIVADVSLALCATTFFVKGMGAFLETALAKWIGEKIGGVGESVAKFCENFGKWCSSQGEIGGVAAKIFGKNASAFIKTRLGPACAVAAIVLSSFFLNDAVKHHDTFNIIMESLNVAFATVDLALMGLSILSFGWAGPVGIAMAIIGGITILIQLIYNFLKPPRHQEDSVEKFIYGPLKIAGYVL